MLKRYLPLLVIFILWATALVFLFYNDYTVKKEQEKLELQSYEVALVKTFSEITEKFAEGPYLSLVRRGSLRLGQYEHKMIWAGSSKGGGYIGVLNIIENTKNEWIVMKVNESHLMVPFFIPSVLEIEKLDAQVALRNMKNQEEVFTLNLPLEKGYGVAYWDISEVKNANEFALEMITFIEKGDVKVPATIRFDTPILLPASVDYAVE